MAAKSAMLRTRLLSVAEETTMPTSAETFAQVVQLEKGKLLFLAVLNEEQLEAMYEHFEPVSRTWRGQFQSMAKAIVRACASRIGKPS